MEKMVKLCLVSWVLMSSAFESTFAQCGKQAGGTHCFLGECCSAFGYCGMGEQYCGAGCQNGPCTAPSPGAQPPPAPVGPEPTVADVVPEYLFEQIFPIRNSFYTYASFIAAANSFKGFGTTGGAAVQRRELAALFAHITLETYGLFYIDEQNTADTYCDPTATQYPCAPGQSYHGRGPLQLSWNFNYGPAGAALKQNLLADPSLLSTNPMLSWEASLWFWNTLSGIKPSCHDVMTGKWKPSRADVAAGRLPGFGVTTDIINGGLECGHENPSSQNRVLYFKEICAIFNIDPADNLDCSTMQPFNAPPSPHA